MTTTDNRIPVPSFVSVLATLDTLVHEAPHTPSQFLYADLENSTPVDLVGHALHRLGAPLFEAVEGRMSPLGRQVEGTPRTQTRFPLLWNRLFLGREYDTRAVMFLGMPSDPREAENFLVYALLDFVASNGRETWGMAYKNSLLRFRRYLNHPTSGFLAQTRGAQDEVRQDADVLTAQALAALTQ